MSRFFGIILAAAMLLSVSAGPVTAGGGAVPVLQVTVFPRKAVVGHQPITFTVQINNQTDMPFRFGADIWHGGRGWSYGGDYPYTISTRTRVYESYCTFVENGCYHYWRGRVAAHGMATFVLPAFSSNHPGKFWFGVWLTIDGKFVGEVVGHIRITR